MRRKTAIKVLGLGCLILVLISTFACAQTSVAPPVQKTIKFGGPFTLTGPMANWIDQSAIAAQDYIRYINDEYGGIVYTAPSGQKETVKAELLWEDVGYSIPRTISAYERFKADGVQFIFCHGSAPTSSLATFASRDKIPGLVLSPSVMDLIMYEVDPPYILCDCDGVPEQGGGGVYWVKNELWKEARPLNVGYIGMDVPTRRVVTKDDIMAKFCQKIGVNFVGADFIPLAPMDTSIELKRQVGNGADWIVLDIPTGAMQTVMKDAKRLGFMPPEGKLRFLLSYPYERIMAKDAQLFEGTFGTSAAVFEQGVPGSDLAVKVIEKYHPGARPGIDYGQFYLSSFSDAIFGINTIKGVLEKAGYEKFSGPAVREALFDCTKPIDTMGILPTVTMDPQWPLKHPYIRLGEVRGARLYVYGTGKWYETPPMGFGKPRFNPNIPEGVVTNYVK